MCMCDAEDCVMEWLSAPGPQRRMYAWVGCDGGWRVTVEGVVGGKYNQVYCNVDIR